MASTLKEISQAAGTSVSTASLILNGRQAHRFTEATRDAVTQAADRLGYRPQRAAQSLVTGKTRNLALLVNDLSNPFFGRYASLLQAELMREDFTAIPIEIRSEVLGEKGAWINWVDRRAVDAVIDLQGVMHLNELTLQTYTNFSKHRPIVFRQLTDDPQLADHAGVVVDYSVGTRAMTEHLAEVGCREVGMVTVWGHAPQGQHDEKGTEFYRMIRDAIAEAGLHCPDDHFRGVKDERPDSSAWCESTVDLLREKPHIQALIVHNLDAVPAVLHGVALAGRAVGEDLRLVSYDNMPLARWLGPGITVVSEPVEQVASLMAQMALKQLSGKSLSVRKRVVETELVIRGSTEFNRRSRDCE